MKLKLLTIKFLFITAISFSQTTLIPDPNFEQALIDLGHDSGPINGSIPTANINGLTSLNVNGQNIEDLTGIRDFVNLTSLKCIGNQLTSLNLFQNTSLTELLCFNNQLTSINLTQCVGLRFLDCNNNQLTSINLTQNINLRSLQVHNNQLTSLNASQSTDLSYFTCHTNQLTSLDVTQNIALTTLSCSENQLTSLNVSNNVVMEYLWCHNNQITTLDVTQNDGLNYLYCWNNQLTTINFTQILRYHFIALQCQNNQLTDLNLSSFLNFRYINCSNNQLLSLNVANGSNSLVTEFNTIGNPDLNCITVDDNLWSTNNWTDIDATSSFSNDCYPQETYVPDDNFENYLETHNELGVLVPFGDLTSMGNQIANDNFVTTASINTVINLDVNTKNISSLRGLEDFLALEQLRCYNNQLTEIDVTNNIYLKILYNYQNQITDFDVTQNTELVDLRCNNNKLIELDVNQNTDLIRLYNYSNQLTTLDVTLNTSLEYLLCNNNEITSLNIDQNTALTRFYCQDNQLTEIDVSQNNSLSYFYCYNNQLTTLDVSENSNLFRFYCNNNQLTNLKVKNGNNTNITTTNFKAANNPDLSCIEVDDVSYCTSNWTNIDSQSYFTTDCVLTYVPDDNFENYLETHNELGALVPFGDTTSMGNQIANDNYVTTANINTVNMLHVLGLNIEDATGLEDFELLEDLNFSENLITNLDISENLQLTKLNCSRNILTDLNTTSNILLTELYCSFNQMTSINLMNNTLLTHISLDNGLFTSLDLKLNILLTYLDVSTNPLTELDLRNNNNTNFTSFNSTNTPNLTCINVDDANYSDNSWTNISPQNNFGEHCFETYVPDDNFEYFLETHHNSHYVPSPFFGGQWYHASSPIGSQDNIGNGIMDNYVRTDKALAEQHLFIDNLDISDLTGIASFSNLETLDVSSNLLQDVDINQNISLKNLTINNNQLTEINVTLNINLTAIDITNNLLSEIDISQNADLANLDIGYNLLTELDLTNNNNLVLLGLYNNLLTQIDVSNNHSLWILNCDNNDLNTLNIQNGNNLNSTLNANNNPNLTCIQVDEVAYCTTNWTNIDAQSYYSTDCGYDETYVPDDIFENYLETHNAQGAVVPFGDLTSMGNQIANDDYVTTASIDTVTMLNVYSLNIADATGLEDFELLEDLNFSENLLTTLDVSENLHLTKLICARNGLTNLDLSNNVLLTELYSSDIQITSIDLSQNNLLTIINLGNGLLTNLDLSQNPLLTTVYCWNNFITGLDLSTHNMLTKLQCQNNRLNQLNVQNGNNQNVTEFDIRDNVDLLCVLVDEQQYSEDYWFDKDRDTYYSTNNCSTVWYINVTADTLVALLAITPSIDSDNDGRISLAEAAAYTGTLDLSGQNLTDISGLQAFTNVTVINLQNNNIADFSPLTNASIPIIQKSASTKSEQARTGIFNLEELNISNNPAVETIDVSKLINLKKLLLTDNPNLVTVNVKNGVNNTITVFDSSNTPYLTCIIVDDINASYLTTWVKDAANTYVTDEADCRARVLTVDTFNLNNNIQLYPNPVTDILSLKLNKQYKFKSMQVFTILGKLIKESTSKSIDFSNISKGIYIVKVITDMGIKSQKILKE